ncbi:mechanosensitive ion channel family protein [Phytohalomonas tamaricis]|uniref:mechanosensitive ion channel family protein n=1 Tax=Phytohalomonas tamaricis TaxID=2081032 RepID=UPI000D0BD858|nr:mechanosensitive ion channel domain-containing protein [Phytohalomonas tamaricis]
MEWLDRIMEWDVPSWIISIGVFGTMIVLAFLLRLIHIHVMKSSTTLLRPIRILALAIHLPLLALLWVYGLGTTLYLLIPDAAGNLRSSLLLGMNILGAVLAVWMSIRVAKRLIAYLDRWALTRNSKLDRYLVPFLARCIAVLIPVFLLFAVLPMLTSARLESAIHNLASLLLIAGVAGVLIHGTNIGEHLLADRFRIDVENNLRARQVKTQVSVLRKLIVFIITVLALASMLMVFDKVRQLGASILASAGIIGVALGFAAQKVLGNLIAGIQIAITQPIRIDDAVIVEGEWGQVEEITLTYVVVRIWDWRRLVLPITYFVEKPFQNWTRNQSELLGTVYIYMDYHVPLDPLREELERITDASELWDRQVRVVQLTDFTERTMQVRILASASSAPRTFDLRCEIREKMIMFINQHYPEALPRLRAETTEMPTSPEQVASTQHGIDPLSNQASEQAST